MNSVNKIITQLENGQHEEALIGYEQILTFGSNEERFLLAEEFFQYGFIEESQNLIQRLLEIYPEEGELTSIIG